MTFPELLTEIENIFPKIYPQVWNMICEISRHPHGIKLSDLSIIIRVPKKTIFGWLYSIKSDTNSATILQYIRIDNMSLSDTNSDTTFSSQTQPSNNSDRKPIKIRIDNSLWSAPTQTQPSKNGLENDEKRQCINCTEVQQQEKQEAKASPHSENLSQTQTLFPEPEIEPPKKQKRTPKYPPEVGQLIGYFQKIHAEHCGVNIYKALPSKPKRGFPAILNKLLKTVPQINGKLPIELAKEALDRLFYPDYFTDWEWKTMLATKHFPPTAVNYFMATIIDGKKIEREDQKLSCELEATANQLNKSVKLSDDPRVACFQTRFLNRYPSDGASILRKYNGNYKEHKQGDLWRDLKLCLNFIVEYKNHIDNFFLSKFWSTPPNSNNPWGFIKNWQMFANKPREDDLLDESEEQTSDTIEKFHMTYYKKILQEGRNYDSMTAEEKKHYNDLMDKYNLAKQEKYRLTGVKE